MSDHTHHPRLPLGTVVPGYIWDTTIRSHLCIRRVPCRIVAVEVHVTQGWFANSYDLAALPPWEACPAWGASCATIEARVHETRRGEPHE